tara:strand:+ start:1085 stop:1372 length:288 start_codon:yes stop_codon:yes gene_type:complete
MKKITQQSVNAFINDLQFSKDNTIVKAGGEVTNLFLHGNLIAHKIQGRMFISNCGWFSRTTKERLNGLPNVSICQKKGKWYLNGEFWNGGTIEVI